MQLSASGLEGAIYHVVDTTHCNNGDYFTGKGTITYSEDETAFSYEVEGIGRSLFGGPFYRYTLECIGAISRQDLEGGALKVGNDGPALCKGVSDPDGDFFGPSPFSFEISDTWTVCDKSREHCHSSDNNLNIEKVIFDLPPNGGVCDVEPFQDVCILECESNPGLPHCADICAIDGSFTFCNGELEPVVAFNEEGESLQRICSREGDLVLIGAEITPPMGDDAIEILSALQPFVLGLDPNDLSIFNNTSARQKILDRIQKTINDIAVNDIAGATATLNNLINNRLNGCGASPDGNDWVVDCPTQIFIRDALQDALNLL